MKTLIEEPYEEWSVGLDLEFDDDLDNADVDQMVDLFEAGFKFRKEMFKGGLTGNDLARMRLDKKQKEKELREKLVKENVVEMTGGESADSQANGAIAQLVASKISDKLSSSSLDIREEIRSLEGRLEKSMEAKIDKLVSASNQVQQVAALQSSYKRGIQAIERKLLDNMKIMQTAIIKTVTDSIGNTNPAGCSLGEATGGDSKDESRPSKGINQSDPEEDDQTPAEVADSRISKVLKDMSRLSDMHVVPGNPQVDPFTANLSESVVSISLSSKYIIILVGNNLP